MTSQAQADVAECVPGLPQADKAWQACRFVLERLILDVTNAFALLHLAQQLCLPSLEARARQLALYAFPTALTADKAGFVSLPAAMLQDLIQDDRLKVRTGTEQTCSTCNDSLLIGIV